MREMTLEACEDLISFYGLEASPALIKAVRRAYRLGLDTDVMKTRAKHESDDSSRQA